MWLDVSFALRRREVYRHLSATFQHKSVRVVFTKSTELWDFWHITDLQLVGKFPYLKRKVERNLYLNHPQKAYNVNSGGFPEWLIPLLSIKP